MYETILDYSKSVFHYILFFYDSLQAFGDRSWRPWELHDASRRVDWFAQFGRKRGMCQSRYTGGFWVWILRALRVTVCWATPWLLIFLMLLDMCVCSTVLGFCP